MLSGRVVRAIGPVIDICFEHGRLPPIHSAVTIHVPAGFAGNAGRRIVAEVAQHVGDDQVRAVSLSGIEGLRRG